MVSHQPGFMITSGIYRIRFLLGVEISEVGGWGTGCGQAGNTRWKGILVVNACLKVAGEQA